MSARFHLPLVFQNISVNFDMYEVEIGSMYVLKSLRFSFFVLPS